MRILVKLPGSSIGASQSSRLLIQPSRVGLRSLGASSRAPTIISISFPLSEVKESRPAERAETPTFEFNGSPCGQKS